MKRSCLGTFFMMVLAFMSFSAPVSAAYFYDAEDHWAKSYIYNIAEAGLVVGYPDGRFLPDLPISRGEFITILAKESAAEMDEEATAEKIPFSDVTKEHWANRYILWGKEEGILSGYEDGTFRPDHTISRREMAVILYRYITEYRQAELLTVSPQIAFRDSDSIEAWAMDAVTAMQRSGIIVGRGDGNFDPLAGATRAETTVMMSNYLKYYRWSSGDITIADIYFNGERKGENIPVISRNNTLLLPARTLLEATGYRVTYYAASRLIVADRADSDIEFWINGGAYYRNGTMGYLTAVPELVNGTAYISPAQLTFSATIVMETGETEETNGEKKRGKIYIGDAASPLRWGENNFNGSANGSDVNGTILLGRFCGSVVGGNFSYGSYTSDTEEKFIGYWQNGMMNGVGRSVGAAGEFFVGTFRDGVKHTGTTYFTDGSRFVGTWQKAASGSVYPQKGQYITVDGTTYGAEDAEWSGGALSKSKW